ncbi:MAG: hypothetical protein Q9207_002910 [Kuettlingeria erythrocarpa]
MEVDRPARQPYAQILSNHDVYVNTMHAISMIEYHKGPGIDTTAFKQSPGDVKKHVAILDCIALLLGYKDGDVAATGFRCESEKYTIIWTKNRSYEPDAREKTYLEDLAASFRNLDRSAVTLRIVITMCKSKVLSRIKKLAKKFADTPKSNYFQIPTDSQATEDLRRFLFQVKFLQDVPLVESLDNFVVQLKALTISSPVDMIAQVIIFAYWISVHASITLECLSEFTRQSFGKVKKLGAYYFACVIIRDALKEINRKSPALGQSFTLLQLQPPPTTIVTPFADTMLALNTWVQQQGLPEIDEWEKVKENYPRAQRGIPGDDTINIKASQHCELTMALYLRKQKIERRVPGVIEVGCNKASCSYCSKYIRTFNTWCEETKQDHEIVVRGEHNKNIDGWVMPSDIQEVSRRVLSTIGKTIQRIVDVVSTPSRRLSDSHSPPLHAPGLSEMNESAMEEAVVESWSYT